MKAYSLVESQIVAKKSLSIKISSESPKVTVSHLKRKNEQGFVADEVNFHNRDGVSKVLKTYKTL